MYPTGRNDSLLICLLCCNVDFSVLSLHLNFTDVNRVLFYTTQRIRNLSLFSELGSYLNCLYTTGFKNSSYTITKYTEMIYIEFFCISMFIYINRVNLGNECTIRCKSR